MKNDPPVDKPENGRVPNHELLDCLKWLQSCTSPHAESAAKVVRSAILTRMRGDAE